MKNSERLKELKARAQKAIKKADEQIEKTRAVLSTKRGTSKFPLFFIFALLCFSALNFLPGQFSSFCTKNFLKNCATFFQKILAILFRLWYYILVQRKWTKHFSKGVKEMEKKIYNVYVVYKVGEDKDLEDVKIFIDHVEAKYFVKNHKDYMIWQRGIEDYQNLH